MTELRDRLRGLIPAVPVPFTGTALNGAAQSAYAKWMSTQPVAGVAIWAHTGRGRHLSGEQRRSVLETWREALPDRQSWVRERVLLRDPASAPSWKRRGNDHFEGARRR